MYVMPFERYRIGLNYHISKSTTCAESYTFRRTVSACIQSHSLTLWPLDFALRLAPLYSVVYPVMIFCRVTHLFTSVRVGHAAMEGTVTYSATLQGSLGVGPKAAESVSPRRAEQRPLVPFLLLPRPSALAAPRRRPVILLIDQLCF